ncbi:hypothetical protein K503DRAFT_2967 [Rhizopogon vinicolor AM-OR11-026]|uniref:DUF1764-domain-containing protein n=1 Tax=Rhizopogon vinicolor AM-OR11-026 TaxID=1314800 RepID=A0A1B7NII1_9AGAM|nr:hypothetical protein K503DRAFT_2967 [Rhizopogon vinicolor AM-OR11-026]
MPTSEIDDIFSAKGKAKAVQSLTPLPSVDENKKKRQKKKDKLYTPKEIDPKTQKKRPAPETVVDPSSKSSTTSKRPKLDVSTSSQPSHEKRKDEDRFKDSRGTAPSMPLLFSKFKTPITLPSGRKTDDGYNIYKEDELGISNTGGDTPQCPFDCNCCF